MNIEEPTESNKIEWQAALKILRGEIFHGASDKADFVNEMIRVAGPIPDSMVRDILDTLICRM